jgi:hypothetical protein
MRDYSNFLIHVRPEYEKEMTERMFKSCREEFVKYTERVKKYTRLQNMYINNRKTHPEQYDTGGYERELSSAIHFYDEFVKINAEYVLI